MALFISVFLCACAGAFAFNLDIPSRVVYRGPAESMFGFTVQCHIDGSKRMILVGAPEDQPYGFGPEVQKPGAVYRCTSDRYSSGSSCKVIDFDKRKTNNVDSQYRQIDQKSGQWFGATLTSSGRNGPIVACAPRYVSYVTAKLNQRDPVGSCLVASTSDANDVNEISPCRTSNHGQRKTGVCQAGFSAAIAKDGERVFLGAPGSFYWQGQVYEFGKGTVPSVLATPEASPQYDDSYMGYSLTVGDLAGPGVQGLAVGVPRGADLKGLVVVYTWNLNIVKNITGAQIGAYFGYSLASGDIDGDGADDIVIGAPMYSRVKTDGYEHGSIYVIYQGRDPNNIFTRNTQRIGEISRGRFGLAVTFLGDINFDGFGDIAVGAPYGGKDGRGVVYIYQGSANGLLDKYSQAITAEEISPTLTTFGFSLSGGVDLDENSYPDLAVGAYKSDSVVFLKARPVVNVTAKVSFLTENGASRIVSMTNKNCKLSNGTQVVCRRLQFCLSYSGINVDQQVEFEVHLDLDSRQTTSKRLFLYERRNTTYTTRVKLTQSQPTCRTINVYLAEEFRDKLTPIEVKITYDLVNQPTGPGIVPAVLNPIIIPETDSLSIQKNCGADDVCIPDLRLVMTPFTDNYSFGSNKKINIHVKIENHGEDAFEAAYYLQLPFGVSYVKMERLDDNSDKTPIYCIPRTRGLNTTVKCDLGNPMGANQKVEFQIILEISSRAKELVFSMETNSTNPEEPSSTYDNYVNNVAIRVVFEADLAVVGTSDPPELHYNASFYETGVVIDDTKLGPQVIHKYNIKNDGHIDVEEADVYVIWPHRTLSEENFMYMLEAPQVAGNIRCEIPRNINPENLVIQNTYIKLLSKEMLAMKNTGLYTLQEIYGNSGGYTLEQLDQAHRQRWSWTNLSADEKNIIKENLAAAYRSQSNTGQRQLTTEEIWARLSQYQKDEILRNLASVVHRDSSSGFTVDEEENIKKVLISSIRGNAGGAVYNQNQDQAYYQKSWGNLNTAEKEIIRENLAVAFQTQTGSSGQQSVEQTRNYWESLSQYQKDEILKLLSNVQRRGSSFGFTAEEAEYLRNILISSIRGNQGISNSGYGTGVITREHNKTVRYDSRGNVISQSESSTEYTSLGHEGEEGSSFNRYNQQGYNQGGSQRGSFWVQNQGQGSQNQGVFVHRPLTTTETVNTDVSKGPSVTYIGRPDVTVVGSEDGNVGGGGDYAAQGSNNQFKTGFAEFSDAETGGSGNQRSYSSGSSYQGSAGNQGGSGYQGGSTYHQSAGSGGYSTQYSSSSSSSSHSGGQMHYRQRRQADPKDDPRLMDILEKCQEKYQCQTLHCTIGKLLRGQEVWLALRSRINASVLNEISKDRAVKLSTLVATRVSKLTMDILPTDPQWVTSEAQTVITPQLEAIENGSIPLWVVVLAAVIGALLLLLLIFALYKCGFFKRNRPSDHAERQPLNGRDEHL